MEKISLTKEKLFLIIGLGLFILALLFWLTLDSLYIEVFGIRIKFSFLDVTFGETRAPVFSSGENAGVPGKVLNFSIFNFITLLCLIGTIVLSALKIGNVKIFKNEDAHILTISSLAVLTAILIVLVKVFTNPTENTDNLSFYSLGSGAIIIPVILFLGAIATIAIKIKEFSKVEE